MVTEENPLDGLILIDTLQRLNIDYHFQDETKAFLERNSMNTTVEHDGSGNLYELALHFRLLRQEGYYVNAGDFCLLFYISCETESRFLLIILC